MVGVKGKFNLICEAKYLFITFVAKKKLYKKGIFVFLSYFCDTKIIKLKYKTMKKVVKLVLLCLVIALVYANFSSVNAPLDFEAQRLERDKVVIERLIDIRTGQVEYRAQNGRYAANFDELISFLKGNMNVVSKTYILNDKQLALVRDFKIEDTKPKNADEMSFSEDEADQIVLNILNDKNPKNEKKNKKRLEQLDGLYRRDTLWVVKEVKNVVDGVEVSEVTRVPVLDETMIATSFHRDTVVRPYVDTLYHNMNYDVEQLRYIPFSMGADGKPEEFFLAADSISPKAQANRKAGGYIQLFEARADFIQYLKGLNDQELNNYLLKVSTSGTEFREVVRMGKDGKPLEGANGILKRRIPTRKVGDVTKNNNNAGNWP